jgi:hypothetical protein
MLLQKASVKVSFTEDGKRKSRWVDEKGATDGEVIRRAKEQVALFWRGVSDVSVETHTIRRRST